MKRMKRMMMRVKDMLSIWRKRIIMRGICGRIAAQI